jgi:acetate kinase
MQKLEEKANSGSRPAKLAIEVFATAVAKTIASYLVSLEGLDLLVFTGGIGEHSASFRAAVCERLRPLGLRMDAVANSAHQALISAAASSVPVRILPAQEDLQIARHVRLLLGNQAAAL